MHALSLNHHYDLAQMAIVKNTKTVFLNSCVCGFSNEISPGLAGTDIRCPNCGTQHTIGSFRSLQQSGLIEKLIPSVSLFRFGLMPLFFLFLPFSIISWIGSEFGILTILICFGIPALFCVVVFAVAWFVHNVGGLMGKFWDFFEHRS